MTDHQEVEESSAEELDARAQELFAALPNPEAREELVKMYKPLAEYLARRFHGRGEPLDDLVQVASIGLLKSIDRFELERGVKFSTYAVPTIIGELKRHFRDSGWAMRVPRRLQERSLLIRKIVETLDQELGRSPTIAEIGARAGLSEEEVIEATEVVRVHRVESLDTPADDEERGVAHRLGTEDATLELLEGWANLAPLLRELPARERQLLYLRFVQGLPQSQIAQRLGISQMHVSRLLARTLERLRKDVGAV